MARYQLVTYCAISNEYFYHEIDGDYFCSHDAFMSIGEKKACQMAIDDIDPRYFVKKID